jgi:hypothetical protein
VIDRHKFTAWWQRLEARFGKTEGADAYLLYLESQEVGTEAFEAAAAAVWATSRFFPRPADFLLVQAGSAWVSVLEHAPKLVPPVPSKTVWDEARAAIPDRAFKALGTIGGPVALREASDLARFRRDFLDAYELAVIQDARGAFRLPAPKGARPKVLAP